jgi:hypothetical protein
MVIFDLKSSRLIFAISRPSMRIWPEYAYNILSNPIIIVDFPLPVLPTMPILYPLLNDTVKPFRTKSKLGLYLTL